MRIRKNAKISPLVYALSSGIVLQPHVCQLNQSPWDVIDFSPPPSAEVNGIGAFAGNGRFIPASEREFNSSEFPGTMPPAPEKVCKTARKGDDHSSHHHVTKKPAGEAEASPRPRRKKAPSSVPDDFYYYSGFGPRWAKKRGESSRNNQHDKEIRVKNEIEIEESDNVEYDEEEVGKKRGRKPIKARSLKSLM